MDGEALVRDYLGRLDTASWPLAPGRRTELRSEVAEHIETALAEAGSRDEVTVRNVLERLGAPEEIAQAEADPAPAHAPWAAAPGAPAGERTWGVAEVLAILFLTLGAIFLPVVGPVIGLAFMWASSQWTTRHKSFATLIVVLIVAVAFIALFAASPGGGSATAEPGVVP